MINDGSALGSGAAARGRPSAPQGRTLPLQQGRSGFLLEQDVLMLLTFETEGIKDLCCQLLTLGISIAISGGLTVF